VEEMEMDVKEEQESIEFTGLTTTLPTSDDQQQHDNDNSPPVVASAPTTTTGYVRKGRFEVSSFRSIGPHPHGSSSGGAGGTPLSSGGHPNADNNHIVKSDNSPPHVGTETTNSPTSTSVDLNAALLPDVPPFHHQSSSLLMNSLLHAHNVQAAPMNDAKIVSQMMKMPSSEAYSEGSRFIPSTNVTPNSDKELAQMAHALNALSVTTGHTLSASGGDDNNVAQLSRAFPATLMELGQQLALRVNIKNEDVSKGELVLDDFGTMTSPTANLIRTDSTLNDMKIVKEDCPQEVPKCAVFGCLRPRVKMGYCGEHYKEFHVFEQYTDISGRTMTPAITGAPTNTVSTNPVTAGMLKKSHRVPFARLRFEIASFDKDLHIGERFGVCKYGDMFKGKLFGQEVSVKVLQKVDVIMELDVEKFRKNVEKLKSLRHPNIVQFMDVSWIASMQSFCIIEEYLPNGSLKDLLLEFGRYHTKNLFNLSSTNPPSPLLLNTPVPEDDMDFDDLKDSQLHHSTETNLSSDLDENGEEKMSPANVQRWTWKRYLCLAQDIVRGLSWLHHKYLTHNNLKPSNVLLTAENNVKISDFIPIISSATSLQSPVSSRENLEAFQSRPLPVPLPSYFYEDPAVATPVTSTETEFSFDADSRHFLLSNQRADIFCLGSIMYEMLAFCHPKYFIVERKDMNLHAREHAFVFDDWRPSIPSAPLLCLPGVKVLIEKCWQKDPAKRPTIEFVMLQLMEMEKDVDAMLRKALEDQIANWEVSEKVKDLLLTQLEQMKDMSQTLTETREQLNQAFIQLRNVKRDVDNEEKIVKTTESECEDLIQSNAKFNRMVMQHKAEIARLKKEIGEDFLTAETKIKSPYAEMLARTGSVPVMNFSSANHGQSSSGPPSTTASSTDLKTMEFKSTPRTVTKVLKSNLSEASPRRTSTTSFEIEARLQRLQEESISRRGSLQEELINKFRTYNYHPPM
jgi:serine/threonine protein kinase